MRRVLISTKPFIFVLFLVGVMVQSVESLSTAISLGTSTKRANSKRANHRRSCLFRSSRGPPAGALGDLRVTVRASPPGTSPRTSYSSRSECPVPSGDFAGALSRPRCRFGQPRDVGVWSFSGDGENLPLEEGREENPMFCFFFCSASHAQFDSATRLSSPGDLSSSTVFSRCRWQSGMPLSCARRLLSSWQRMQSSRSLQPR